MCINAETSLASFAIGEIAGLLLLASKNNDKKVIGLFIMFYSLVQLFEYNIYSPSKKKLYRYKYYGVSYILFIVNNIY